MYLKAFVFILTVDIVFGNVENNEITCKDDNGENVDWYYLYKLPGQFSLAQKNSKYVYITSKSPNDPWKLSNFKLSELESTAGQTLAQAYYDPKNATEHRLLIAYNDEPPNQKPNERRGHTKGVVVADAKSGFWLIHSVPLYPNISINSSDYNYPSTGMNYGQSFLCLSLDAKQIDIVGKQLIYNEPQIYEKYLPSALQSLYPNIERLIQGKRRISGPYWNDVELSTLNQETFKSFAKSSKFSKELYEDWVAPTLNTNLYVETWRKGSGNFPSNCTQRTRVWNISKVKIGGAYSFPSTDDHSKWGVSDAESDWICVGDINRAMKQTQRGGGTVCFRSKSISANYRSLIADFEPCTNSSIP